MKYYTTKNNKKHIGESKIHFSATFKGIDRDDVSIIVGEQSDKEVLMMINHSQGSAIEMIAAASEVGLLDCLLTLAEAVVERTGIEPYEIVNMILYSLGEDIQIEKEVDTDGLH